MIGFNHVVIDLETLSLEPTATVLSIGAVHFNLHTGEVASEFEVNVDFAHDEGGAASPDTLDWWLSDAMIEAWNHVTQDQVNCEVALQMFYSWLATALPGLWKTPQKYCIWAMGSEFDPPILNSFARRHLSVADMKTMFNRGDLLPRQSLADMRFLFKLFPGRVPKPDRVAHTALDDARAQYHTILKYRRLGMFNGMFNPLRNLP